MGMVWISLTTCKMYFSVFSLVLYTQKESFPMMFHKIHSRWLKLQKKQSLNLIIKTMKTWISEILSFTIPLLILYPWLPGINDLLWIFFGTFPSAFINIQRHKRYFRLSSLMTGCWVQNVHWGELLGDTPLNTRLRKWGRQQGEEGQAD